MVYFLYYTTNYQSHTINFRHNINKFYVTCWKYFICEIRFYIDKIVDCWLLYILGRLIFLLPYDLGKQWISPSVCASQHSWPVGLWARAHGCPVSIQWATVRLCDELSRPNMVSEPNVVPGMMWLTCEGECWKYFTCETRFHINKIVGRWLAYILGGLIFLLPYGFGKQWTSPSVCASQRSWPVGLWARAHGCPVSTRVSHGEIMWRIVMA